MASEPTEEAIADFVGFTSTTREQAVDFLKVGNCTWLINNISAKLFPQANNLDSQKAINAYFEDPTGSQLKVYLVTRSNSGL
jgi:hypothetical protein